MSSPSEINTPMMLLSVAGTAICWGMYGPLLKWGHEAMVQPGTGRMRPFIIVGVAYLVVAIILPLVLMQTAGMDKTGGYTAGGIWWSFIAGTAGALGAFGLLMALSYGGKSAPGTVMPLVFGFAPIVSTLFSLYFAKSINSPSPFFFVGLLMVGMGAVCVLYFNPSLPKKGAPAAAVTTKEKPSDSKAKEMVTGKDKGAMDKKEAEKAAAEKSGDKKPAAETPSEDAK